MIERALMLSSSCPALALVVVWCLPVTFVDLRRSPVLSTGSVVVGLTSDGAWVRVVLRVSFRQNSCASRGRAPCSWHKGIVTIWAWFEVIFVGPDLDKVQNRLANCPSRGRE
jgi:hypothetical protein